MKEPRQIGTGVNGAPINLYDGLPNSSREREMCVSTEYHESIMYRVREAANLSVCASFPNSRYDEMAGRPVTSWAVRDPKRKISLTDSAFCEDNAVEIKLYPQDYPIGIVYKRPQPNGKPIEESSIEIELFLSPERAEWLGKRLCLFADLWHGKVTEEEVEEVIFGKPEEKG